MRPRHEFDLAMKLVAEGLNDCEISRRIGIPRCTILDWRRGHANGWIPGLGGIDAKGVPRRGPEGRGPRYGACPACDAEPLDDPAYAHLLGLYLGDGTISKHPRKESFRLRIFLDERYVGIIDECAFAMAAVHVVRVGRMQRPGCVEVYMDWKHWPCLFPQHGPGPKHLRALELHVWQQRIVDRHPKLFLRGLIHSDGCRDANFVKGKSYPRYSFSNNSEDIKRMFCRACDLLGVRWTTPKWNVISIARRSDVRFLDGFIGPKT